MGFICEIDIMDDVTAMHNMRNMTTLLKSDSDTKFIILKQILFKVISKLQKWLKVTFQILEKL